MIIFHVLQHDQTYTELGGDYFDRHHVEQQREYFMRRLQMLGLKVTSKNCSKRPNLPLHYSTSRCARWRRTFFVSRLPAIFFRADTEDTEVAQRFNQAAGAMTVSHTLQERLINIVRRFSDQRIAIIGDAIADKFVHGSISRVSREAPVFILRHEQTQTLPGGAANCAMNLVALGAHVSLISVTGSDESGNELRAKLETAGVNIDGVLVSDKIQTTTKVRILAGHSHSSKQQVIRIDYDGAPLTDGELREALINKLEQTASPRTRS